MHNHTTHTDPPRNPHLQLPIEREMEKIHTRGLKQMLVDVTKVLVTQVKEK